MAENDLKNIPGVGRDMERHLFDIGIHTIDDLVGEDPEALYARECERSGGAVDRCVLYVYRLAVYYANNDERDEDKFKWWNWKD